MMDFDSEWDYGLFEGIIIEILLILVLGDIVLLFSGELYCLMGILGEVVLLCKIVVKVVNYFI